MSCINPLSCFRAEQLPSSNNEDKNGLLEEKPQLSPPSSYIGISWEYSKEIMATFASRFRALWDRGSFVFLPKLATPAILTGCLLSFIGFALFTTSCFGLQIPLLQNALKNIPLSLTLSLLLIKSGYHAIDGGVHLSNHKKRIHQENLQQFRLLCIEHHQKPLSTEELQAKIIDLKRVDNKVDASMRIFKPELPLPEPNIPWDLDSLIKDEFFDINNIEATRYHPTGKWYAWWNRRLPTLGKLDMALGGLMAAVAILGLIMSLKKDFVPIGLEPIAEDPHLSICSSFMLLAAAIGCTKSGWRMINYDKREEKREQHNRDLQKIHLGLKGIEIPEETREIKMQKNSFTRCGKKLVPKLSTLSILVGVILTGLGVLYFTVAKTNQTPPKIFHFLISETTTTVPFAAGTILSGLYAIANGSSLSEKKMRLSWKKISNLTREHVINALMNKAPELPMPAPAAPAEGNDVPNVVDIPLLGEHPDAHAAVAKALEQQKVQKWYSGWLFTLKGLWIPNAALGGVMFYCGFAILFALAGWISVPRDLTSSIPSLSYALAFSIGSIAMGINALNDSWRMGTYHKRKNEDRDVILLLSEILQSDARYKEHARALEHKLHAIRV